jgi:hypothetical protein
VARDPYFGSYFALGSKYEYCGSQLKQQLPGCFDSIRPKTNVMIFEKSLPMRRVQDQKREEEKKIMHHQQRALLSNNIMHTEDPFKLRLIEQIARMNTQRA